MNDRLMHRNDFILSNESRLQDLAGVFFLILAGFVYLSHLAFLPLNVETDEARRALVSLEMELSGNYSTPTLNGEIYLNKPPLYNWIVVVFAKLFGGFSMFNFRLPVIISSIGLAITVFWFTKKYLGKTIAFFTAFAFLTNGRLLIYDSFNGLIDTTFSWLVYTGFMLVYHFGEKKKWYSLFIFTYLIVAAGFLLKGFPSLVFQGLTLLTYFIWKKKFRLLFHPAHFIGFGVFLLIVGGYYFYYFSVNDLEPQALFSNLINESTKRTVAQRAIKESIINLFTFPFEVLYHFAPWTILIIATFNQNVKSLIKGNSFVHYSLLVFIVNLVVYWVSPGTFARYLFMFLPLLYSILFFLFFSLSSNSWQHKTVRIIAIVSSLIMLLTFLVLPFLNVEIVTSDKWIKSYALVIIFAAIFFVILKYKKLYLYGFVLAVIVFRMGFNWFILEPRKKDFEIAEVVSKKIAEETKGKSLFILRDAQVGNFDGMSFHIAKGRKEVLKFNDQKLPGVFYIADNRQLEKENYTSFIHFKNYLSDSLQLVQFNK